MKYIILIPFLVLAGCTGTSRNIEALGVSDGDNAFACLRGDANTNATFVNGGIAGFTVEVSPSTDTSDWTAEDWASLARICVPTI